MSGRATYDDVPYPGHAYSQTHPDRLATIATLFGLNPARVDRCRVLEVGCGDAANLIPMACTLPEARLVGIDLSVRAIERGRADAAALGLTNLTLVDGDLRDLPSDLGEFDYVIAHGLYSWVPAEVRDRLMALVRRHLSPDGVACISYNAYPGFYARRMLREMMRDRVASVTDPADRVRKARDFADALGRAARHRESDAATAMLTRSVARLNDVPGAALLHDDLADVNDAFYLREFVRHAVSHGLQYLGEADDLDDANEAGAGEFAQELRDLMARDDMVGHDQLLDYIKGRQFKQTLLCHGERRIDRREAPGRLTQLLASALLTSAPVVALSEIVDVRFTTPRGSSVATRDPIARAALLALTDAFPERLTFDTLLAIARRRSLDAGIPARDGEADHLASLIWSCFTHGVVSLHTVAAPVARVPGPRPEVSPLARLQLARNENVTSLVHRTVRIDDEATRRLVPLADGTRDRAAILAEWRVPGLAPDVAMLDACLAQLGRMALLVR